MEIILLNIMKLKLLLLFFVSLSFTVKAQNIDSIFVNLYTDSLKLGTYNYINVDGLLSNGRYLPLDSNHLIFKADCGKFDGNSLWLDPNITLKKVNVTITMRKKPEVVKNVTIYIKQAPDPDLKTNEQILEEMRQKSKQKKNKKA